ncbi:MAG: hypothetical protein H0W89_02260 [Candidatus Levybacteria bacterium]|nr:hypothetical protein [Candidatus Levybacteria bacterium]
MLKNFKSLDTVLISRLLFGFFILTTVFSAGAAYYFYTQYKKEAAPQKVLSGQDSKTPEAVIKTASELIELPKDEEPVIATVDDKTQLGDQEFFTKAANGDKVIVYPKAGLAVLYRPSTNKIIASGPAQYNQPTAIPASSSAEASDSASTPASSGIRKVLIPER